MHRVPMYESLPCGGAGRPRALDCPVERGVGLGDLVGSEGAACRMSAFSIEARASLPAAWQGRYGYALVRRGHLIRVRSDAQGRSVAVDAVGPGALFRITPRPDSAALESSSGAYAVSRVLLCVTEESTIVDALRGGGQTAIDLSRCDQQTIIRMELLADARARPAALSKVAALLGVLADGISPLSREREVVPSGFLQRDLAALVGVRHESVCRALRELQERKLIEQAPDQLRLLDRAALNAL